MDPAVARARLAAILPRRGEPAPWASLPAVDAGARYLELLAPSGLAVPDWPVRYGGLGLGREDARVIARVRAEFAAPDLYLFAAGLGLAGPTLLRRGSHAQRERWLPAIASGRDIWCQMFSEPDAGSDLANVATRASWSGGAWRLSGQKVWTSRALHARWGLCLARTDPELPKHAGLTMFVVDLRAAGCTVRPLVQMNGDDHFSEVFLDEVTVLDEARIGAVGAGWALAKLVLELERTGMGDRSGAAPAALPSWLRSLAENGQFRDPVLRDRATRAWCLDAVARLTSLRALASRGPGAELVGGKLRTNAAHRAMCDVRSAAAGAGGMLLDGDGTIDLLTAPSMSIRGGTDQIQRNIIAERFLGLPAERRRDLDVPWRDPRRIIED